MSRFSDEFERQRRQIQVDPEWVLRWMGPILLGILVVVGLFTCWFTVEPENAGVVVRLGRYARTVDPGLHLKLPWGLEQVSNVAVKRQLKEEFGFRTASPGIRTEYEKAGFEDEAMMLTGDLNIADVEWVTQFRISEPRDYLFKVRNVRDTFRVMNEAVMREVIGDRTLNEVLTFGREAIEQQATDLLEALCRQYEMGISISRVILQNVNPPAEVENAYKEVNQAQQEKERLINEAQQEYNRIIPRAEGDAARIVREAEGYAVERVNRARGEAQRFLSLFEEYRKAPEVTRLRIYLETMESVLGTVGRKVVVDEQGSGILPLLNLDNGQP